MSETHVYRPDAHTGRCLTCGGERREEPHETVGNVVIVANE